MRNRLYRSDCKGIIEQLATEGVKVDLIYLDPPFSSNRTYSIIFNHGGVTAQQKAYHDMWDFTESSRQLVLDFRDELDRWDLPDAFKDFMRAWLAMIEGGTGDDRKLLNYLMYMTQRLIRFRDVLSPTGSLYFHCDPTASHYLKVILDGVLGRENFRSEVIWKRTSAHSSARRYGPVHDTILFYSAADNYVWNRLYQPYDDDYIETFFDQTDDDGRRYKRNDLTGAGTRGGETGQPWRGIDITAKGRHWAHPPPSARRVGRSRPDPLAHQGRRNATPQAVRRRLQGSRPARRVDRHQAAAQPRRRTNGLPDTKAGRSAVADHRVIHRARSADTRSVLRMRDHRRGRPPSGPILDRDRYLR